MKKIGKPDRKTFIIIASVSAAFVVVFAAVIITIALVTRNRDVSALDGNEVSGVWIASVSNIDFPSSPELTRDQLEAELDAIVATCGKYGMNAIYFQVRPSADALYESDIFPVSRFVSGSGDAPLDCLEYLVEKAHSAGIAVHAWVNPLRVTTGSTVTLDTLSDKSPAKQHPEWTVSYADGRIYFDCGNPDVRALITDGISEIVENYDVDGIIFDDYFYPYPQSVTAEDGTTSPAVFDDSASFEEYGGDFSSVDDWRRENVNSLVRLVYDTVKKCDEGCEFGVAPFGIWKNGYGDKSGSQTTGAQSYSDIYCDTLAWIDGGYIDYIAPQLYWRTTDKAAPYDVLCDWWETRVEKSGVRLLISHAAYRYDGDWENPAGMMTSQVEYARGKEEYRGSIFYGYDEINRNLYGIGDEIAALNGEYKNSMTEKE